MNKTLALIVSASVILVASVIVITLTSTSLTDLDRDTQNVKENEICQFQANQAEPEDVDRDCISHIEDEESRDRAIASNAGIPVG